MSYVLRNVEAHPIHVVVFESWEVTWHERLNSYCYQHTSIM